MGVAAPQASEEALLPAQLQGAQGSVAVPLRSAALHLQQAGALEGLVASEAGPSLHPPVDSAGDRALGAEGDLDSGVAQLVVGREGAWALGVRPTVGTAALGATQPTRVASQTGWGCSRYPAGTWRGTIQSTVLVPHSALTD